MIEHYEFAKSLRNLLRRADRFGYDLLTLKEEILHIAELQEAQAKRAEMQMIVQSQAHFVDNYQNNR